MIKHKSPAGSVSPEPSGVAIKDIPQTSLGGECDEQTAGTSMGSDPCFCVMVVRESGGDPASAKLRTEIITTRTPFQKVNELNGRPYGAEDIIQQQKQNISMQIDLKNLATVRINPMGHLPATGSLPSSKDELSRRRGSHDSLQSAEYGSLPGTKRRRKQVKVYRIAVMIGPLPDEASAEAVRLLWNTKSRAVVPRAAFADAIATQFNLPISMDPNVVTGQSKYFDIELQRGVIKVLPKKHLDLGSSEAIDDTLRTLQSIHINLSSPNLMSLYESDYNRIYPSSLGAAASSNHPTSSTASPVKRGKK